MRFFVSDFSSQTSSPSPYRKACERFRIFSKICGVIRIEIDSPVMNTSGTQLVPSVRHI
jgi:hypothetical protein